MITSNPRLLDDRYDEVSPKEVRLVDHIDFIADFWRFFEKSRVELTTYHF